MGTATMVPTGTCPECGEAVLLADSRLLAPERVSAGLFDREPDGEFRRRRLVDIATEARAHQPVFGGGYDLHECPLPLLWYERD